jgi:hypothetical protein
LLLHDDADHVMRVPASLLDVVRKDIIGPCHEVVSGLSEREEAGVLHDLIGNVEVVSVLDQRPARLASGRIAPEGDIRLEIGDDTALAVNGLLRHGLEEKLHRLNEALLSARRPSLDQTAPVAVKGDAVSNLIGRNTKRDTDSRVMVSTV